MSTGWDGLSLEQTMAKAEDMIRELEAIISAMSLEDLMEMERYAVERENYEGAARWRDRIKARA